MDPVTMGFRGRAARMDNADILDAARRMGCDEAEIRALLAVESSGSGFDDQGRPKILFEPHIMWRQVQGDKAKLAAAVNAGVAYRTWGTKPYPRTSEENYTRLRAACAIDRSAALMSASWGVAQVMGFNWRSIGFPSVEAMVLAAMDDEAAQVGFMLSYMEANNLLPAIRSDNWRRVIEVYNGPGQVEAYYKKWSAALTASRKLTPSKAVPVPLPAGSPSDALNDREWLRIRGEKA